MKLKRADLDPRALTSFRGPVVIRDTIWGPVVQKKGKYPKSSETPAQWNQRKRFAFAAIMAASPVPEEYQTAVHLTEGTEQVPRDALTMAALGRYYIIEDPDGKVWQHAPVEPEYLTPRRAKLGFQWSAWDLARATNYNTGNFATKGLRVRFGRNFTIAQVNAAFLAVNGASYMVTVARVGAGGALADVVKSAPQQSTQSANIVMEFELAYSLLAANSHYIFLTRTDLLPTTQLQVSTSTPRWLIPTVASDFFPLASTDPQPGNIPTGGFANVVSPFGLGIID